MANVHTCINGYIASLPVTQTEVCYYDKPHSITINSRPGTKIICHPNTSPLHGMNQVVLIAVAVAMVTVMVLSWKCCKHVNNILMVNLSKALIGGEPAN